jgi:hypothetical protein
VRRAVLGAAAVLALTVLVLLAGPSKAATSPPVPSPAPSATTHAMPAGPGQGWLTGRRQRLLAVWILVDVGGLLLWFGSEPVRAPKLLGSVGAHRAAPPPEDTEDQPIRGIGRFARPRRGPPSRLV